MCIRDSDEIAGAVLVEVAQLECLVRHGTARCV